MELTPTHERAAAWMAIAVLALLALRAPGPVLTPSIGASVRACARSAAHPLAVILALPASVQLFGFVVR